MLDTGSLAQNTGIDEWDFAARAQAITGRKPVRHAPPPDVELPPDVVASPSPPVPQPTEFTPHERRYMRRLATRTFGENEAVLFGALGEGRAEALTARALVADGVLPNERAVRDAVETLRIHGYPICSSANKQGGPRGYWRAGNGAEFVMSIKAQTRRALRQLVVVQAMKRACPELFGQTWMELEEAVA